MEYLENKIYFKASMILKSGTELKFKTNDLEKNVDKFVDWLKVEDIDLPKSKSVSGAYLKGKKALNNLRRNN